VKTALALAIAAALAAPVPALAGRHSRGQPIVSEPFGSYSYLLPADRPLTRRDLDRAARVIARDAGPGRAPEIVIDRPGRDGRAGVYLGSRVLPARYSAGAVISSRGPRFASGDVATVWGAAGYKGWAASASLTTGLGTVSHGGYVGGVASLRKATRVGDLAAQISGAHYRDGGRLAPAGISGDLGSLTISDAVHLGPQVTVTPLVRYGTFGQEIAAIGYGLHERYSLAGVRTSAHGLARIGGPLAWSVSASVMQQLSGSADVYLRSPTPRAGNMSSHAQIFRADVGAVWSPRVLFGGSLSAAIHGQRAPGDVPVPLQFYVGGPGRGSAYPVGVAAGGSGVAASLRLTSPAIMPRTLFADVATLDARDVFVGLDAGRVIDSTLPGAPALHVASYSVGIDWHPVRWLRGSVSYSHSVGYGRLGHDHAVNFEISALF